MSVNIPKKINDPFYRYTRPTISTVNEKLGKKINNLDSISESVNLKPKTIIKFIQKKIGCQSKKDILYCTKYSSSQLDDILEELIELLICPECENPEFKLDKQKKKIYKECLACGYKFLVTDDRLLKHLKNEF